MTCRHAPGDPNCGSHPSNVRAREEAYNIEKREEAAAKKAEEAAMKILGQRTPDAERWDIVDFLRVGSHIVLKVLYPNCAKCAYEGNKVMVFLNVHEAQLIKWTKIDPHFRNSPYLANEAPSPAARFPASKEGWADAVAYARGKEMRMEPNDLVKFMREQAEKK